MPLSAWAVLYNLLANFRAMVLPRPWFERRLRAVRDFVFLVGADLISQGRKVQIRLALPNEQRPELLRRLRTISEGLPIAAQLESSLTDLSPAHPHNIITPIPLLTSLPNPNSSPESSTAESRYNGTGPKYQASRKANYNQNGGTREMLFGKRPMQTLSRTFH